MRATWDSIIWTVLIIVLYYLQVREWKANPERVGDSDEENLQEEDDD